MKPMKQIARLTLAAIAALAVASTASATEWTFCGDEKQSVEVGLLMGQADTPSVVAARLSHKDINYVTAAVYGEGKIVKTRQKATKRALSVDFHDETGKTRVGDLNLRLVKKGDESFYRGTLRLNGQGSWKVACDAS